MSEEEKISEDKKLEITVTKVNCDIIKKENNGKNSNELKEQPGAPKNAKDKHKDIKDIKNGKDQYASLKWGLFIFVLTFILSLSFSFISQMLSNLQIVIAFGVLVFFIFINILFDIIAVSTTACSVEPFLAMASKKIKGAKIAVKIVKNAEKVSNICGDVVGDICGIISGSLGALIVVSLLKTGITLDNTLLSILFSSTIAALTVGGKALGKKFAFDNCQKIVYFISKILSVFSRNK